MSAFLGLFFFIGQISLPPPLEMGDQEFTRINYPLAEAIYDSVLTTSADSAGVLWRLARVMVCMADVAPREQRVGLYRQAEAFAQRCILADSMKSEGHTWRAAALGSIAMFEGGKTRVRLCYSIKKELECAVNLNPRDDIAYSILGSFYMALGNLSWIERQVAALFLGSLPEGGYDESEAALKKAIALAPKIIRHRFELGRLYMSQDRKREALGEFQQVVSLPVSLARDRRTQRIAARLIRNLVEE